ncbi:glutamyl-tRNA(Gln) amidotransferase subunit C, mitochondrial [Anticarsia gemmatalis]|uniref:glutamyl-tRNA(Gln) amidotransferase subunit C, mitochondrial n=1 Tax=Anticarsia gemmatalis TaxID=129554 RepID=UPI003F76F9CA
MIFKSIIRTTRPLKFIQVSCRNLNSKIPATPVSTLENEHTAPVKVDRNTISLLERLSLVKYDTPEGVKILEDSITFANKILHINTDGVEPLYSVLEDKNLTLREDKITQGNCQKDILKNAAVKEDDYFVAPIGNIPLHEVEVDNNIPSELKQNEN